MRPERLPPAIWARVPIEPVPLLAELREQVLARSETRCPKWAFRLAADLAVQLQPRPDGRGRGVRRTVLLFEGRLALVPGVVPRGAFASGAALPPGSFGGRFVLEVAGEQAWNLQLRGLTWERGCEFPPARAFDLRTRLADAFAPARWRALTAGMMLSPRCLACGKVLTDPASMARFIGPECAGTSSLTIRRQVAV
jgi:hypothetical protein